MIVEWYIEDHFAKEKKEDSFQNICSTHGSWFCSSMTVIFILHEALGTITTDPSRSQRKRWICRMSQVTSKLQMSFWLIRQKISKKVVEYPFADTYSPPSLCYWIHPLSRQCQLGRGECVCQMGIQYLHNDWELKLRIRTER